MRDRKCNFQILQREGTGLFKPDIDVIVCGLTRAGRNADIYCLCNPEICPIYQTWKMMSK
jgi:hypothetical protein